MRVPYRVTAALAVGLLALSLSVSAFGARAARAARAGNRGGAGVVSAALLSTLNLTADQQSKIEAANAAYRSELQKSQGLQGQERRQVMRQARETYQAAVQAVLTADQQKLLKDRLQVAADLRGLGPFAIQVAVLDLTDEQKPKVKEIATKYEPQLQAAREAQRNAADRAATRQQMRDLNMKIYTELQSILTTEQTAKISLPGRRNNR
jgi:Spy/CpxP family protein refolding chaperone